MVIYNVAGILFFVVTVCLMIQLTIRDFFGDISIWRRRFKESHSFVETPFRCFARPEVFVPTGLFATELPIVCSNFWVPPGMVFPDIKVGRRVLCYRLLFVSFSFSYEKNIRSYSRLTRFLYAFVYIVICRLSLI